MPPPEVTIDQGTLRGCTGTNLRGDTILKFKGIPYGKPPIGALRFKAPQPADKWSGVLDATKEGDVCFNLDLMVNPGKMEGSENCLFLNVYTKTLPDGTHKRLQPVMFWIHGGAFTLGSGTEDLYGPNFLLTEDVVLVTINYRLGLLGFLNFDDTSLGVPGNAGLKDMVLALKWVQKNVANFNGDPSNVTIFGESAGGAAVTLLFMSPLSKGLFHRAIAQSGCALNPWVTAHKGVTHLANVLGVKHDERAIYQLLMQKSTEELYEIQQKHLDLSKPSELRPFSFVVENSNSDAFLDVDPIEFIKTKQLHDVPIIFGFNSCEGMVYNMVKSTSGEMAMEELVPWQLGYTIGTPDSREVVNKMKKFYYGDEEPSEQNITKKYDILTDVMFAYGIYVTIVNQFKAIKSPIFLYQMTVETELNFLKHLMKITSPGVSHCDDVGYLFNHFATPEVRQGSVEETSLNRFVKLWTNFAKFGNPTPDPRDPLLNVLWKPITDQNVDYLDIGQELVMLEKPLNERMSSWKEIYANSPAGHKYQ